MNALDIQNRLQQNIQTLPTELLEEVYDFVMFLKTKKLSSEEKEFIHLSNKSFNNIWDNDEDSQYDKYVQ